MGSLDDMPKRHHTHDIADAAENAFTFAVDALQSFLIQQKDRRDYGTDVQLEVRHEGAMTNLRVHVQLKGTDSNLNADSSVSIAVARTNLNYLLSQPDSLYVCYHRPTQQLLVRFANDVFHEYERHGAQWFDQVDITVRFTRPFDDEFQEQLKRRVLASGRTARDRRLAWEVLPPEHAPAAVRNDVPTIEVPADAKRAAALLKELYEAGEDAVLSKAFSQFDAVLRDVPGMMDVLYMAEINLGIDGGPCQKARVHEAIDVLQKSIDQKQMMPGPQMYCQGNAWLALGDFRKALDTYESALALMTDPRLRGCAAQCCKNMGSALESLELHDEARKQFERALELDPDLGEAHFALGMWHRRAGTDLALALSHLDHVVQRRGSSIRNPVLQGWRIELLFKTGDANGAFRDIQSLIGESDRHSWIAPWCARMVATHGKSTLQTTQKSLIFWKRYLSEFPDDHSAEQERLLCLWKLREARNTDVTFEQFREAALRLIETNSIDNAFMWDRIGHWAQWDGKWQEAEASYRKAFELDPDRYGYCLGTALNFLDRHAEALDILLSQAETHQPDAMSWFQVAVAREGTGDIPGCIAAYKRALALDPDYDLAWFNLGGIYWNEHDSENAIATWREGVSRFPDHEQSKRLQRDLPPIYALIAQKHST